MLSSLFEPGLSPQGTCLLWDQTLVWINAGSDVAIGLAYFIVSMGLAPLLLKRRELMFGWIFWLLALVILACGTSHFMNAWVLWHPDYGVQALIKAFTAIASVLTAGLLLGILPRLLALPSTAQFQQVADQLSDAEVRHEHTVEKLRRTEENFQLLVQSVHDCAMFMIDPEGHVSSWNTGAAQIKQYTEDEIIGRHFSCFYTEADREAGKPARALAIAAREGTYQEEGWRLRKDGTPFVADVLINPILDRAGVLIGFAKITRDITRRRQVENELEQARAALAQSQKMEAVGHLTGGIAHDFNNMLTAILGSLEMMELRREAFSPPATKMLQVIRHAAQHGAQLTRHLLAFSRKQALAPALTDINRLVFSITELLRRTLGDAVTVETVMAGGLWPAFVDSNQVESALLNLAINARDAMPSGGRLTIETGNATLDANYAKRYVDVTPGQYVFVTVTDTGVGMSAEVLEHAFEPFYTTKEVGRGSGLGLSQVYGFVKQSGGHVQLSSEVGRGASVKLYFPRPEVELESGADGAETTAGPLPQGRETILLVEDDDDVRSYSTNAARHLGYNVIEAGDATQAMTILDARADIDLLFTDVGLPGVNGRELSDRARQKRPDLKVIYTSGYARTAIANLGLLERGVIFLPKPFRLETLAYILRSALDPK